MGGIEEIEQAIEKLPPEEHPSLRFRRLQNSENSFTVRIGDHYRALGRLEDETITWSGLATTRTMTSSSDIWRRL